MITLPSPSLVWVLAMLLLSLVLGSLARLLGLVNADEALRNKRLASLRTWWILAAIGGIGVLTGRLGICLLLTIVSLISFREYTGMLGVRDSERPALIGGYILAVINYLWILFDQAAAFVVFIPVGGLAILALVQLLQGKAKGYIRTTGGIFWGMMVLFYGMGHAAYVFIHPAFATGPAGPAGWFLYLIILTEANDIAQALVGRSIGGHKRHRITPTLSPKKTWEGFIGGIAATLVLACALAPWLTSLSEAPRSLGLPQAYQYWAGPLMVGFVIAVAGFFGDINMSGIKRDSGVKDGSKLLPGMGGLVDRIDSLTFTAPAFVYLMVWWML
jgi:phosphatidate cytidylyltransferase